MGFKDVKKKVIDCLKNGCFQHEARFKIDEKNLLQTGEISPDLVVELIKKATGDEYTVSPHHADGSVDVHVILCRGWYVKFYFVDPDTIFISVHQ